MLKPYRTARKLVQLFALGVLPMLMIHLWLPGNVACKPLPGGIYNVALEGEPSTLDPAYITDIYAVNVAMNLFDGLVELDKDLNVIPSIAQLWKVSRDQKTYTFMLQSGVKFHNGRELNAQDFIYSFSRILAPETNSPVASLFLKIRGAKAYRDGKAPEVSGLSAPSPYKLQIQLEEPFKPFLSILGMANAKVVPREAVGPDFASTPVGTGPFRLQAWDSGKQIVLKSNKEYFGQKPYLDTIKFHIYKNIEWEKIFQDFERGFLDQSMIPSSRYDQIISDSFFSEKYQIITKPSLNLVYIGMNVSQPPLDNVNLRKAIVCAVDTEKIVRTITKRGAVAANGILPPGIAGYDPEYKPYGYDPEKAKLLLEKAGFPSGEGLPVLEMWTVSKSESVHKELEAYRDYLGAIGLKIDIRTAENWGEFKKVLSEKKPPLFYLAWYADYPDPDNFLNPLFYSKSKSNRMGFKNPTVDELLTASRMEMDYMKRIDMCRNVQEKILDEAPIIPQHVNSFNYLFQPWVKGIEVSYLGAAYLPFAKMWVEH